MANAFSRRNISALYEKPQVALVLIMLFAILPALGSVSNTDLLWIENINRVISPLFDKLSPNFAAFRNILFHGLASVSLYMLLYKLTRQNVFSMLCGILFAVEPAAISTVSLNDNAALLAGTALLFQSLSVFCERARASFVLPLILAVVSPSTLPLLILWFLIQMWPTRLRTPSFRSKEFYIPTAAAFGLAVLVGILSHSTVNPPSWLSAADQSIISSSFQLFAGLWKSLLNSTFYQSPVLTTPDHLVKSAPFGLILTIGVVVALFKARPTQLPVVFGFSWFILAYILQWIALPSSWFNPGNLSYAAQAGLCVSIVHILRAIIRRCARTEQLKFLAFPGSVIIASVIILVFVALFSFSQYRHWSSAKDLFCLAALQPTASAEAAYAAGAVLLQQSSSMDAIPYLREALQKDHEKFSFLKLTIGKLSLQHHDFQTAVRLLSDYLKKNPTDANALQSLGTAYIKLDQQENAIAVLKTTLTYASSQDMKRSAAIELGKIYYYQQDYEAAYKTFKSSIEIAGQTAENTLWIATAYSALHRHHEAIEIFEELKESLKNNRDFLSAMMVSYIYVNQLDEAKEILKKLQRMYPADFSFEERFQHALREYRRRQAPHRLAPLLEKPTT